MMRFKTAAFSTALLTLSVAWPAAAQFYGGANNYAPAATQGTARGLTPPANAGANLRVFNAGGGGGGFWGGGGGGGGGYGATTPWSQQYGSYITNANSGVLRDSIAQRQADSAAVMSNQDIKLRQLQLRQATFDEMMYEKMNTPPPEVEREQNRLQRLSRARNTPPDSEIYTGLALNEMLVNIQRIEARENVRGYMIPLDSDTTKHLNVTTTEDMSGSNELFKKDQALDWPIALADPNLAADRKRVMDDMAAMVKAQQNGMVDRVKAADARKYAALMKSKLYEQRFSQSFTDYSEALTFINKLNDSIDTLAKPGAKSFVDGTYSAKGDTVGELIDYMTKKGLRFARSSPGYEPNYLGFYQQLVTYEIGLSRLVGDQSTSMYQAPPMPMPKQ